MENSTEPALSSVTRGGRSARPSRCSDQVSGFSFGIDILVLMRKCEQLLESNMPGNNTVFILHLSRRLYIVPLVLEGSL